MAVAPSPATTVLLERVTPTVATGAGVTATDTEPLRPSLVAVMRAEPADTPVMVPDASTVATDVTLDVQLMARPVSRLPAASRRITLAVAVLPATMDADDAVTTTVATGGGATVSCAEPVRPSLIAVMAVVPGETATMLPVASTVATFAAELVQAIARPPSDLPLASVSVAVAEPVVPVTSVGDESETFTAATGAGGAVVAASPPPPQPMANTMKAEQNARRRFMASSR